MYIKGEDDIFVHILHHFKCPEFFIVCEVSLTRLKLPACRSRCQRTVALEVMLSECWTPPIQHIAISSDGRKTSRFCETFVSCRKEKGKLKRMELTVLRTPHVRYSRVQAAQSKAHLSDVADSTISAHCTSRICLAVFLKFVASCREKRIDRLKLYGRRGRIAQIPPTELTALNKQPQCGLMSR